jgi:hypothetical protein
MKSIFRSFQGRGQGVGRNQPIRLPGLILQLRSGQAPGVCSGLILSGAFYPDLKIGVWRRRTYQGVNGREQSGKRGLLPEISFNRGSKRFGECFLKIILVKQAFIFLIRDEGDLHEHGGNVRSF